MSLAKIPIIYFYEANELPYGIFCNYKISPIKINGIPYQSVEHYYQSQKFYTVDASYMEIVRKASTPNQSKILARMQTGGGYAWRTALNAVIKEYQAKGTHQRKDWEEVKEAVMLEGLLAKFKQHRELGKILLLTGDAPIIEKSPRDWYWGCGSDGEGKNRLGALLMQVREQIRSSSSSSSDGGGGESILLHKSANFFRSRYSSVASIKSSSSVAQPDDNISSSEPPSKRAKIEDATTTTTTTKQP